MAKLKEVSVGDIVLVPGPIFGQTRRGPRYMWNYAIIKRIYLSKNGPAVEVDEAYADSKIVGKKYLVKRCLKADNDLYTPEYFQNLPKAKPTPFYR